MFPQADNFLVEKKKCYYSFNAVWLEDFEVRTGTLSPSPLPLG